MTRSLRFCRRIFPWRERLGIQYSHPTWLVERWLRIFGEQRTQALLESNNRVPALSCYLLDPHVSDEAMASLKKRPDARSSPGASCATPGLCTEEIPPPAKQRGAAGSPFRTKRHRPWRIYWR